MEMPKVNQCDASECAYNTDHMCHALAVTIGDPDSPLCDTFFRTAEKGGEADSVAGVGACKTSSCRFNEKFECRAPGIEVGHKSEGIDCLTYEAR